MSHRAKILAVLILFSMIATIILIFYSSKAVKNTLDSAKIDKTPPIDLVKLEESYKSNLKQIVDDYGRSAISDEPEAVSSGIDEEKAAASSSPGGQTLILSSETLINLKDRLLALKVPTAFKDLHLNLILALDKAENYLIGQDKKNLEESLALIELARSEYPWLKSQN